MAKLYLFLDCDCGGKGRNGANQRNIVYFVFLVDLVFCIYYEKSKILGHWKGAGGALLSQGGSVQTAH